MIDSQAWGGVSPFVLLAFDEGVPHPVFVFSRDWCVFAGFALFSSVGSRCYVGQHVVRGLLFSLSLVNQGPSCAFK